MTRNMKAAEEEKEEEELGLKRRMERRIN